MISFTLYKPNSSNTGAAASLQLGQTNKGATLFLSSVKQKSWSSEKRLGTFYTNKDGNESSRVKFNEIEIGGLISAIRLREEFSAFHTFDQDKTTISFKPYTKKNGGEAFSLTVAKNGVKIGIGIELGEAEAMRVFLEESLREIFWSKKQEFKIEAEGEE